MAAELTPEEEEIASGLLPFQIDGKTRLVPELKRTANREWRARFQEVFASLIGVPSDTPDGLDAMADAERELVLAYDQTHALGDLSDATERQIDAIYNRLVMVANPLASSPMAVGMAILRAVAESARESSTNGASPTGTTAAPTILTPRSPSGRSPFSTRRRRNA
jgi:hypothetical protein